MFSPIFGSTDLDLSASFERTKVAINSVSVVLLADDSKPEDFYPFSLILNGDTKVHVKYQESPENMKFKTGFILTNLD